MSDLVGLPGSTSVGVPTGCIFFFTPLGQVGAKGVSVLLVAGQGLPSFAPLDGLGYEAQWHEPTGSLRVQLPEAVLSIDLQLDPEDIPSGDLLAVAKEIFRIVAPRALK
jgi:hypothetical protein